MGVGLAPRLNGMEPAFTPLTGGALLLVPLSERGDDPVLPFPLTVSAAMVSVVATITASTRPATSQRLLRRRRASWMMSSSSKGRRRFGAEGASVRQGVATVTERYYPI